MCWTCHLIGLDPARFRSYSTAEGEELNITTLDSQIPESERYNDADPLKILCRHCKTETNFAPIYERPVRYDLVNPVLIYYLPVPISGATEIPLIARGADVSNLPQSSRKREHPGAARETDPGTYLEVLPWMDRVR